MTAREVRVGSEPVRLVECGPPDGEPVILLHGWAASAYTWHRTCRHLGESGWRAIGPDLPGHGLSAKPSESRAYTEDAMLTHLIALMDALGIRSAHMVGHSMGGLLALDLAARHPDRCRSVFVISPIGVGAVTGLGFARLWARSPFSAIAHRLRLPRWIVRLVLWFVSGRTGWYTARDIDEYWAPSQFPEYTRALAHLLLHYDWRVVPEGEWSGLRTPVRVAIGGRDPLVRTTVEMVRARVPGGTVIDVVPDAGHILHEEAPASAHRWITDFLKR